MIFFSIGCIDVNAFDWLMQLRLYWEKEKDIDDCIVRQTNTQFQYGYEYLGNSGRLVITPLTGSKLSFKHLISTLARINFEFCA